MTAKEIKFTNLDKIYFSKIKATKGDVVDYYRQISEYILPHLKNRPLTIKRYPGGIQGEKIYQRHITGKKMTEFVEHEKIYVKDKDEVKKFIMCQDLDSLLYLAQLGTIEFHTWYSTISNTSPDKTNRSKKFTSQASLDKSILNYPTFVVFDLDPPKDKFSKQVIEVALDLKKTLDERKLTSVVKTSGKSGLHVYIPIKRKYKYEEVRKFACEVGEELLKKGTPITMEVRKNKREKNKVFFDCNQNSISKSLVSVYSLRATPEATISFPVEWKDLKKINPKDFNIKTVPAILKNKGDIWLKLIKLQNNSILL